MTTVVCRIVTNAHGDRISGCGHGWEMIGDPRSIQQDCPLAELESAFGVMLNTAEVRLGAFTKAESIAADYRQALEQVRPHLKPEFGSGRIGRKIVDDALAKHEKGDGK